MTKQVEAVVLRVLGSGGTPSAVIIGEQGVVASEVGAGGGAGAGGR